MFVETVETDVVFVVSTSADGAANWKVSRVRGAIRLVLSNFVAVAESGLAEVTELVSAPGESCGLFPADGLG